MAREKKEKKESAGKVLTDSQAAKKYKGSGLASDITVMPADALWIPSRNIHLNYAMGGGIPYGKTCEIFGGESSGKTLVAKDFAYGTQYLDGIVLWDDAEQSFDPHWAELNGLDLTKIVLFNSTVIEEISDWVADMAVTWRSRLTKNQPILFILDSLAAIDTKDNINSSQLDAKAEMGNRAKAIYRFVRTRNELFADLGVSSIYINQLRQKVGAGQFEDPDTTPGGNAMKFYAHQRMAFFQKKRINVPPTGDSKVWVGNEVSVRMKKNKVAPPRSTFDTEVYFNEDYGQVGFSRYYGLGELLDQMEVVERAKGSSYYYLNGEVVANGKDNFQKLLEDNSELRSKLIRRAGINTLSRTKKKIERLIDKGINRYPLP